MSENNFVCRIESTQFYDFPFPKINDIIILIPEPYNSNSKYEIGVYNDNLQKIGNIPKLNGANVYVGEKIRWRYNFAVVKSAYPQFGEILIQIALSPINQKILPQKINPFKNVQN